MWKTYLTVVIFLLAAVVLLSVSILLKKNGKFPNIHVGSNPAMRKRGIGCVESQDRQAQNANPMAVNEKANVFNKPNGQREFTHSVVARKGGMKSN